MFDTSETPVPRLVIFPQVPAPTKKKAQRRSRTERRLRSRALALGSILTVLAILLSATHQLAKLERDLYDFRVRWFQFFRKVPTNRLVHVDIDDDALETLGRWPWP